jgi:ABC-type transport system substrate-binding protein
MIELIRANWKAIGVDINVRHYPRELFFAPIQENGVVYGTKWDIITFAWSNEAIGDYSAIYGGFSMPPSGQDDTRWNNPAANAAMLALFGHYDQSARNADVAIVVKALHDEAVAPVLYIRPDVYAYNKDLKNFAPNNVSPFDDMLNVDI